MDTKSRIDAYLAGTNQLRQAIAGMTHEQLVARPVPGKWSTLEVVCHLADFDPIYCDRMKRVIAEDKPSLVGADEKDFAARLAYHERDVEEELTIIETGRKQMARILRTLKTADFERVGIHDERGSMTLDKLLENITRHIPHHVQFIMEKRKALGLK